MNTYGFPGCSSLLVLTEKKNSTISRTFCKLGLILAFQEVLGKILSSFWWGSQPNQRERQKRSYVTTVVVSDVVLLWPSLYFFVILNISLMSRDYFCNQKKKMCYFKTYMSFKIYILVTIHLWLIPLPSNEG